MSWSSVSVMYEQDEQLGLGRLMFKLAKTHRCTCYIMFLVFFVLKPSDTSIARRSRVPTTKPPFKMATRVEYMVFLKGLNYVL